jgi:hypothetical protein
MTTPLLLASGTFWLNLTNGALGLVVVAGALVLGVAALSDVLARARGKEGTGLRLYRPPTVPGGRHRR